MHCYVILTPVDQTLKSSGDDMGQGPMDRKSKPTPGTYANSYKNEPLALQRRKMPNNIISLPTRG